MTTTFTEQKRKTSRIIRVFPMKRLMTYMAIASSALAPCLLKPASAQIPSAETKTAPAAASLSGTTYVAWVGKDTPPAANIWYTTSNGSGGFNPQTKTTVETEQAPALAATADATLYLAWTNSTSNEIYFSTNLGATSQAVCIDKDCPTTMFAPALASNGSILYLAYVTESKTIELASSVSGGPWTSFPNPPGTFLTSTAPALAVYGDQLFLAFVKLPFSQVVYTTWTCPHF
jgi:hypothetical protein